MKKFESFRVVLKGHAHFQPVSAVMVRPKYVLEPPIPRRQASAFRTTKRGLAAACSMLQRIDSLTLRTHQVPVLKLLRHLLCLGLLFGLAGNGVAIAAPCIFMTQSQPAAMVDMPDCQMAERCTDCGTERDTGNKSDKDKAPGCMAMTACAAMLAMKVPAAAAPLRQTAVAHFWSAAARLTGRDVAPEPEPPTLLG